MELAIDALKAGAFDFLNKPVELQALRELVGSALRLSPGRKPESVPSSLTLLGESIAMERIRNTIAKLARSQAPVYISGESGTGKELVARMIHAQGPRADQPFVPVNCGAIPSELMESELFGYKKGSFTGAATDKEGLFQAANGGTLFLDEVADLPLSMQVKLLRAIQEKAVRPVGAREEDHVDIRILSATHKELEDLVKQGVFRQDLFYRLNVIELPIPPLRERRDDIPLLVEHILGRISSDLGMEKPSLSDEVNEALNAYPFSGNIRELENILERATTLCEGNIITSEDLHLPENSVDISDIYKMDAIESVGLEKFLDEIERQVLVSTLEKVGHNKTAAAKHLGLTFRSFRYRLKKFGLD